MLREVELYLFYCSSWGIGGSPGGTNTINIYNALTFPTFIDSFGGSVGSVTLTSDMVNCEFLTTVFIPLRGARSTSTYFIEFSSATQFIEWIYIAEARFADELIPTPITTPLLTETKTTSTFTTLLVVTIVVFVLLVVTGRVVFAAVVHMMKKTKSSSRGVVREGDINKEYEEVQETHEVIETKGNQAYNHAGAGGESGGVEMARNEAYTT